MSGKNEHISFIGDAIQKSAEKMDIRSLNQKVRLLAREFKIKTEKTEDENGLLKTYAAEVAET